jgi:hypothetical protein
MKFGLILNNQSYEKKFVLNELYCIGCVQRILKCPIKL